MAANPSGQGTFYARSANRSGEKETVKHHLERTAELCGKFAGDFGCRLAGEYMGLLHDFGKYSTLFQEVLNRERQHVDHALPGAAFLFEKLCPHHNFNSSNFPLVVAVRNHHTCLDCFLEREIRDWYAGERYNSENGEYSVTKDSVGEAVGAFNGEIALPAGKPRLPDAGNDKLKKMLLTRMLFSALTDADYSASAEHFDPDYLAKNSLPYFCPEAALESLTKHLNGIRGSSGANTVVNRVRDEVYELCFQAGKALPTGVYTLTAPTGTGKTLAMLAFGLNQMIWQRKKRLIFVLPYLSIIEQNAGVYAKVVGGGYIIEDHSQSERKKDGAGGGGKEDDAARELSQRWDAPFIVTTSVKFFESLFACSGPACRKLHYIADSVVLFDEAQSLPLKLAGATLNTVKELAENYGVTALFSTATQPRFDKLPGMVWEPTELVPDLAGMYRTMSRVQVEWELDRQIALSELADSCAENKNACVIVNLRSHALTLYRALSEKCAADSVFLISSDLCPAHRKAVVDEIRRRLRDGEPCYLCATQCIEAGVDLSFDRMYRALGPLESIIQAAGRCNRNGRLKKGRLTVFVPDEPRLYPDAFYEQAANAVRTLAARHAIDIDDPGHIAEYYEIFCGGGRICDREKLTEAIRTMDYRAVAKEYRLIEDSQAHVLVPYSGEIKLFGSLAQEARRDGIGASWLRRAAPITVGTYDRAAARDCCERTQVRIGGRMRDAGDWFILGDPSLYDADTGLHLNREINRNL